MQQTIQKKKVFHGNKYNFKIFLKQFDKNKFVFSVDSIHKKTKRTSAVTSVNIVLSELRIDSNCPRFWGSEWILSKKEAKEKTMLAEKLFSDKKFNPYLESYLDLDRKESEWENYDKEL